MKSSQKVPPPRTVKTECHVCGKLVSATANYGWPFVLSEHAAAEEHTDEYGFCRGAGQSAKLTPAAESK